MAWWPRTEESEQVSQAFRYPSAALGQRGDGPKDVCAGGGAPWSKFRGGLMEGMALSPLPTLVCLREKDDNRASN